jgi:hypothetical protein
VKGGRHDSTKMDLRLNGILRLFPSFVPHPTPSLCRAKVVLEPVEGLHDDVVARRQMAGVEQSVPFVFLRSAQEPGTTRVGKSLEVCRSRSVH